jgi:beta-lactamase regulating signal transducer with metallopeptidase domain
MWRLACLKLLVGLIALGPITIPILPLAPPPTTTVAAPAPVEVRSAPSTSELPTEAGIRRVAEPIEAAQHRLAASTILMAVWLIGVAFFTSLSVRELLSVRKLRKSANPIHDGILLGLCRREATRLGVNRLPRIAISPVADSPLLAGIWQPSIILPTRVAEQFDELELRLILAHELAHQQRSDLAWNWLATFVGWLFFFHPLVWLLRRSWLEVQEAACDELLVQRHAACPSEYGRLLLKFALPRPQLALATAGVLGAHQNLQRRILAMTRVREFSRYRLLAAASLISIFATICIVPWQLVAQEASKPKSTEAGVQKESNADQRDSAPNGAAAPEKTDPDRKDSPPNVKTERPEPHIIIAEHVLLWDGQRIMTWNEIVLRLRLLRRDGPFHATFLTTSGVSAKQDEGWQFWHDRIMKLYREMFQPVGVTFGSVSPRASPRYDAIKTEGDLVPDPMLARKGKLLAPEGPGAAGAQVVVLPKESLNEVSLKGTQLSQPYDEQWVATDEKGQFTIYPNDDDYFVVALHPSGFTIEHGSSKDDKQTSLELQLRPWASVTFTSTGDAKDQSASLEAQPLGEGHQWPRFSLFQIQTAGKPIETKVPPGRIVARRSLKMDQGTSISLPLEAFSLAPDESHTLELKPPTDDDRKRAKEIFDGFVR